MFFLLHWSQPLVYCVRVYHYAAFFFYSKDKTSIQRFFEEAVLDGFLLRSQTFITWYYQMISVDVKTTQCYIFSTLTLEIFAICPLGQWVAQINIYHINQNAIIKIFKEYAGVGEKKISLKNISLEWVERNIPSLLI